MNESNEIPNAGSSETSRTGATEYRDEKRIIDYFVSVVEERLAGRQQSRIIAQPPVDVCHLGVLGPWRPEVDELEAESDEDALGEQGDKFKTKTSEVDGGVSTAGKIDSIGREEEDRGPVEGSAV